MRVFFGADDADEFSHLSMSFLSSTLSLAFFIPWPFPRLSKAIEYIFMYLRTSPTALRAALA